MELFGLKDKDGKEYKLITPFNTLLEDYDTYKIAVVTPEPKFKVGDWVAILRENGEVIGIAPYLSLHDKETCILGYENKYQRYYENINRCRPATKEEIETQLKKIADEKYKGQRVNDRIIDGNAQKVVSFWHYDDKYDKLWYHCDDGTNVYVYNQGKWAEIIPEKRKLPKTKEELLSFLYEFDKLDPERAGSHGYNVFLDQYED